MSVTIKDVARLADCSIKTVSRVINNEAHISDEIRSRVQIAIRECGYSPNLTARRLVQKRSYAICILVYPGFMQPASVLLTKLLEITYEENYDLLLQTYYPSFPQSRKKLADIVAARRFDGYISTPPCEADGFVESLLETYKTPLVQINPFNPEVVENDNRLLVKSDEILGGRMAAEHLVSLGHRKIAFLRGPRNIRATNDRQAGFSTVLAKASIVLQTRFIQDSEYTFDGGYTATKILMAMPDPPTAIYAANDEAAQGVLYAAQELGLKVPMQLSICGHDDMVSSSRTWPGLTTVHQPVEELLEYALSMLIDRINGSASPRGQEVILPKLIIRGSTTNPQQ